MFSSSRSDLFHSHGYPGEYFSAAGRVDHQLGDFPAIPRTPSPFAESLGGSRRTPLP